MKVPLLTRWHRPTLVVGAVAIALTAATVYLFVAGLPQGEPTPTNLPGGPNEGLDGTWALTPGSSLVGYRVKEFLGEVPAPDVVVGRTPGVTGSARIRGGVLEAATFTANLRELSSDIPVLNEMLQIQGLDVATHPEATFVLTSPIELGAPPPEQTFDFKAVGDLTLHGVSNPVSFVAQGRWDGDFIRVAGRTIIRPADFDITTPAMKALRVANQATIETALTFSRAGGPHPSPIASPSPTQPPSQGPPPEPAASGVRQIAISYSLPTRDDLPPPSIYVVRENGTGLDRLTHGFAASQPVWAPDGRFIAFSRMQDRGFERSFLVRIFVMSADGSGIRAVTTGENVADTSPAWSPDGARIAFVRQLTSGPDMIPGPAMSGGPSQVFVVNADGNRLRRLTRGQSPKHSPSWSPDGRTIAYVRFGGSGNDDIWVMRADGTNHRRLTRGPAYDYSPAWSPDGSRIVFARDGHIWSMRADGSGGRQLTTGPRLDGSVQWSRQGRELVFARGSRIMVMNTDGSDQRRVPLPGWAAWPSLMP